MTDMTIEEQEDAVKVEKVLNNAIVLSNIIELSTSVISNIAGKDIADTLDKENLNKNILSRLIANRIREVIENAK